MKKFIILAITSLISLSTFAQKKCTVNLSLKTYLEKVSTHEIMDMALEITKLTNIRITNGGSDYSIQVYASRIIDHHNARFAYISGKTEVWPSNQIQNRAAIKDDFGTSFMRLRKLSKKRTVKLMRKTLRDLLKSCDHILQTIKSTGNGTLSPINGDTYITETGAQFLRVGDYWKAPNGLLWGKVLTDDYTNVGLGSPAVRACEDLGARLPTTNEYKNLISYFSQSNNRNRVLTTEGHKEFNSLFPWSSGLYTTSTRDADGVGYDFFHETGNTSPAMAHWALNVRCVK
jgi:hypothetical protein